MVMATRWKRYGKDRLYLSQADETKLGFFDLVTDEPQPESPECLAVLLAAVQEWQSKHDSTSKPVLMMLPANLLSGAARHPNQGPDEAEAPQDADPTPIAAPRPWLDLSTNLPGAEARERAEAAQGAAPVKTLLARAMGVKNEERAWRIGADGEAKVAAQLEKIAKKDGRWRFIHAIPVGNRGSDIDHLAIGPGGVFTVNTKHHPGASIWVGGSTFLVDGHKQPYIRSSQYEATRAASLLSATCGFPVHVEGLIVPVNATDVVVKSTPDLVHVVSRRQVASWLLRHGETVSEDDLAAIFEAARRSTTWRS